MINFKTWLFLNESLSPPFHPKYSGAGNIPGSLHDAVAQIAQDIHNTKTKDELINVLKKYNLYDTGVSGYTNPEVIGDYLAMQMSYQNYELRPDTNYWKNANEASKIAEKKYDVRTDQSADLATQYLNLKNASLRKGQHKLHVQIYNHNSEKLPQIVQTISSEPEFEDQFYGFKFATLKKYSSDFTDELADQMYSKNEPADHFDQRHRRDRFVIYLTDKGHKDKKIQNYLRSIDVPFDGSKDSTTGGSSTQIYAAKLYHLLKTKQNELSNLPPPFQGRSSKEKFHWHIPHLPDMGPEGVEPEKFVGHEKHIGQIRAEILGNQLTLHGTGFTEFLDLTPEQVKEIKKNWTKEEILENRNLFGSIPDRKQLWSGSMKLGMVDIVLHGNKLKISSLPSFANHVEIQLTEPQYMQMLQTIATIKNHNK